MRKLFKERKLFKGGNYMRKYGRCVETIQGRKQFKGGNYMRKYGIWVVSNTYSGMRILKSNFTV